MAEEVVSQEKNIFGRKVFFINASFNIEQIAKGKLRDMEYETYTIDFTQAKNILRQNPNSICLVNLDYVDSHSLTVVQYLNFIISCKAEPDFATIFFGVISVNNSPKQMNLFFYNTDLPCGYILASPNKEDFTKNLISVLDVNEAKGRRQYVRASCDGSEDAYISIQSKNGDFKLQLVDFSSVGLACKIPDNWSGLIQPNTVLSRVSLCFYGAKFPTSLVVLKEFKKGDINVIITLFAKTVSSETRKKVRNQVFKILETNIERMADYAKPDKTLYSLKVEKKDAVVNLDELPTADDLSDTGELEAI